MKYTEAIQESLKRKWVIGTCSQGEQCWCRTVRCEEPVMFIESEDVDPQELFVVRPGELGIEYVNHIIKLHNQSL